MTSVGRKIVQYHQIKSLLRFNAVLFDLVLTKLPAKLACSRRSDCEGRLRDVHRKNSEVVG